MRSISFLQRITFMLAAAYCVYCAAVIWFAGGHGLSGPVAWLASMFFFGWVVSPAVSLARRVMVAGLDVWTSGACFIGAVAQGVLGVAVYQDALFGPRPDPQSALVLVFVPIYQWVGIMTLLYLARKIVKLS